MSIAFITHDDCQLHKMDDDAVEVPERLQVINEAVASSPVNDSLKHYKAPLISKKYLMTVHDKDYVQGLYNDSPKEGIAFIDSDTQMNPHTLQAARRAAGAGVRAVDLVMNKKVDRAFCNVRPPGHHAAKDEASGFCFFNNIAIAATHALKFSEINRVAIIDFDVHHGDGTEDHFQDNEDVLLLSSFQHPLFPFWDESDDNERMVHQTLKKGTSSQTIKDFFNKDWLKRLEAFRPDFIFISAGFDAHKLDPIGGLKFLGHDYAWMTSQIVLLADKMCQGRVVSMLEGGYSLKALKESSVAHLNALVDPAKSLEETMHQKKIFKAAPSVLYSQSLAYSSQQSHSSEDNVEPEESVSHTHYLRTRHN